MSADQRKGRYAFDIEGAAEPVFGPKETAGAGESGGCQEKATYRLEVLFQVGACFCRLCGSRIAVSAFGLGHQCMYSIK